MRARPSGQARGHAIWRLLPVGIILLVIVLLAMQLRDSTFIHREYAYTWQLRHLGRATLGYVIDYDGFFPLAWHVSGPSMADDLSNVSYYRFLIAERVSPEFRRLVTPDDVARHKGDVMAARRGKFAQAQEAWTEPGTCGWTRDYFGPATIFRWPDERDGPAPKHTSKSDLLSADISYQALLANVNASLPNPEAKDPDDPEHEAEMRKGFSFVRQAGMDIFVGVGPSLRRTGDLSSSRFDFRHNGAANVLFLDGHVELIRKDDTTRLEKIHRNWNSLEGTTEERPASPSPAP
ncbi:MAG: hypothetical protein FJ290_33635 [Planctomycetes bacterium]|nr:hypothetical protein [Planctomycetota bacterium]